MFMDESAFDEIEEIKVTSKFSRPSTAVTASNSNSHTLNLDEFEQDDDLPAFRSAGALGTPSSSRARMLAQQRELQMKKRQSQIANSGMVRSSIDSVNSPVKNDGQFTPAVRQFSAPKAVKDLNNESEFARTSFNRPMSSSATNRSFQAPRSTTRSNRYSDDDDEDDTDSNQYTNRKGGTPSKPPLKGGRNDDYHDNRRSNNSNYRNSPRREEQDYEDTRRGVKDMRVDDSRGNHRQKPRRDEEEEEEPDMRRSNNSYNNSKNNNANRSRNNQDSRRRGQVDDDEDDEEGNTDDLRDSRGGKWTNRTAGGDRPEDSRNATVRQEAMNSNNTNTNTAAPGPSRPIIIAPDLSNMRRFLTTPIPKNCGVVQCYIRRNKSGTNKLYPVYSLFLKEGDVFLMASRKRPKNKTSNYLISMDQTDLNRSGSSYLGKLRSNFVGTEFQIFDDGVNPKDSEADDITGANSNVRCELGAVMYAANVLGSRGPRKMQVAIPALDENNQIIKWKDGAGPNGVGDDMITRMKERNFRDLLHLINKPPRWNEQVGAYVLNFNGRVTMASVKNFQLVDPEEQNTVVLQFGRVAKDEFTMDLQYPMSPFQAFALTLSSFDSKIACD